MIGLWTDKTSVASTLINVAWWFMGYNNSTLQSDLFYWLILCACQDFSCWILIKTAFWHGEFNQSISQKLFSYNGGICDRNFVNRVSGFALIIPPSFSKWIPHLVILREKLGNLCIYLLFIFTFNRFVVMQETSSLLSSGCVWIDDFIQSKGCGLIINVLHRKFKCCVIITSNKSRFNISNILHIHVYSLIS